jgi:hypothetical protein
MGVVQAELKKTRFPGCSAKLTYWPGGQMLDGEPEIED